MIETTAIVIGSCVIDSQAYIGHYTIIGSPRRKKPNPNVIYQDSSDHWEKGRGVTIARGVVVSHYVQIDDGSQIREYVWLGSRVRIGHDAIIGPNSELYYCCQVYDRVIIGEGVTVAGFICNDSRIGARSQVFGSLIHRLVNAPTGGSDPFPTETEPSPVVEEEAIVGMGAIVIGGITVGRKAYIAAGSILTTDAEPNTLYKGIPARPCGPAPSPIKKGP